MTPFGPMDGAAVDDEAQRALGEAMLVFHQNPVLNHTHLPGFDADDPSQLASFLLDSFENIKIRLHPVNIEELSKIWSAIGRPYRLSVAYEVTLAQITPTQPPTMGAGVVSSTGVMVRTLDSPRLTGLAPARGPVATITGITIAQTQLVINGFGLTSPGESLAITVGDASAAPVGSPTDRVITVAMPQALEGGPDVNVRVRRGPRTSLPLAFTIDPWLSFVVPVRTALDPTRPADLHLTLTGAGFVNVKAVLVDGAALGTLSTSNVSSVSLELIGAAMANGLHDVRVELSDGSLSNTRSVQVIPLLNGTAGYAANSSYDPVTRQLTLHGDRLAGGDVRLDVDGRQYAVGPNASVGTLLHTFAAPLIQGDHRVAVMVDGHRSREIQLEVP
jgi:hypothetical protein